MATTSSSTSLNQRIRNSQVWKSVFRYGYPNTPRNRALNVAGNIFLHLHPAKVKMQALKITYTWGLGGISFLLFLILTVTGILLMFFYVPSVDRAYADMLNLATNVTFGTFLRNMHRWTAHAMVLTVFLHMCRVFYTGGYKIPREFNWVIGVILFVLTLVLSFTGYLLPWDQLSYWAITVGTNIASYTPLIGEQVRFFLLGGYEVGQQALLRFYVLHVIALPLIAAAFRTVHFWRIRKDGGISSPGEATGKHGEPEEKVHTWPDLLIVEFLAALAVMLLFTLFSLVRNAPLEDMANANLTPNPSKAPWYFMNLQELLLHMNPSLAGVIVPIVLLLGLMAIPYVDSRRQGVGIWFQSGKGAVITLFSALYTSVAVLALILFDSFFGGVRAGGAIRALTGLPDIITGWVVPIVIMVSLSALLAFIVHWRWDASTNEVIIALFTGFVVCYWILTICGFLFRGPGMDLYWPWAMPHGYNPLDSF